MESSERYRPEESRRPREDFRWEVRKGEGGAVGRNVIENKGTPTHARCREEVREAIENALLGVESTSERIVGLLESKDTRNSDAADLVRAAELLEFSDRAIRERYVRCLHAFMVNNSRSVASRSAVFSSVRQWGAMAPLRDAASLVELLRPGITLEVMQAALQAVQAVFEGEKDDEVHQQEVLRARVLALLRKYLDPDIAGASDAQLAFTMNALLALTVLGHEDLAGFYAGFAAVASREVVAQLCARARRFPFERTSQRFANRVSALERLA